jgi:carbon dioxide concentrating mechanism protein CcmO
VRSALGILEIQSWTAAMVSLDAMEKAGDVRLLQAELNDFAGALVKIAGLSADVRSAIASGRAAAEAMRVACITDVIDSPAEGTRPAWESAAEFNPILSQDVVHSPTPLASKENQVSEQAPFAIGLIETQGFTAVIEAIDTATKAANVEVVGKEKLGGGYITVVIRGDVAAVKAAIAAGQTKVEGLGKLIAAHVIARPSAGVLGLLPKG